LGVGKNISLLPLLTITKVQPIPFLYNTKVVKYL